MVNILDSWEYEEFSGSRAFSKLRSERQLQGIYSEFSTKLSFEGRQEYSSLRVAAARELACCMRTGSSISFERDTSHSFDRSVMKKRQYSPSVGNLAGGGTGVNY